MATAEGGSSKTCQFKMDVTRTDGWGGLGKDLPHSRIGASHPLLSHIGSFQTKSHW